MDIEKDTNIQPNTAISESLSQRAVDPISFFEMNDSFVYVFKKTEKLTSALYVVTNLFSDLEPMKWSIRRKSSELLSLTVGYKDLVSSQHADFIYNVRTLVLEIVSLLEVSYRAGLISEMNYSIIKQEFSNLTNALDHSASENQNSRKILSETFFDVVMPQHSVSERSVYSPQRFERQGVSGHAISSSQNDPVKDKKSVPDANVFKRTNRQNIILNLLKKKPDLTIKDVGQVIRDCSEKTIQRELISLIEIGVLKKTGERRWSRYSLAEKTS